MTRWWKALLAGPLCVFAALNWWHTARDVGRFFVPAPVWDYFLTVEHYARYRSADWSVFWIPHNEHRILFPELIFAADSLWFHGRTVLPLAVSFGAYFAVWMLMARALLADRSLPRLARWCGVFLSGGLMGWLGAAYPLSSPILLQWTLSQFAAVLALTLLRTRGAPLVVAAATVCCYSSANGLLIWPILIVAAVAADFRWRPIVSIAGPGALLTALYFTGYRSEAPIDWWKFFAHPGYAAKFLASLFAMPFGLLRLEPAFGIRIGFFSFAALALLAMGAWRLRLLSSKTATVLWGYLAFLMGSGVLIAAGRMKWDDPTFADARAVRFLSLPLTYWAALALMTVWVLARVRRVGSILAVTFSLFALLPLHRLTQKIGYPALESAIAEGYATQQWAALSLEAQISDAATLSILHPDLATAERLVPLMRVERLAVYSQPGPFWIGKAATSLFRSAEGVAPVDAGILTTRRVGADIATAGWSAMDGRGEFVFVDENGIVVGLGRTMTAGLPREFKAITIPKGHRAWFGFVNGAYGSRTVTVWQVSSDGRLIPCPGLTHFSVDLH